MRALIAERGLKGAAQLLGLSATTVTAAGAGAGLLGVTRKAILAALSSLPTP